MSSDRRQKVVPGVLACPLCLADVPVTVEVHGDQCSVPGGTFRCEPCEMTFRVPAGRVKDRAKAALGSGAGDAANERDTMALAAESPGQQ